jgi:hypothetical protein
VFSRSQACGWGCLSATHSIRGQSLCPPQGSSVQGESKSATQLSELSRSKEIGDVQRKSTPLPWPISTPTWFLSQLHLMNKLFIYFQEAAHYSYNFSPLTFSVHLINFYLWKFGGILSWDQMHYLFLIKVNKFFLPPPYLVALFHGNSNG